MSATNRGAIRQTNDLYVTPQTAITSLLSVLHIPVSASFHEPCRGSGAIYDRILCETKSYCELSEGSNYLTYYPRYRYNLIITNPPFSLALEFLQKSLWEADTVIYLLRLNFLGSVKRHLFWQANRPSHVLALTKRPIFMWACKGKKGKKGCGALYPVGYTGRCTVCSGRVGPATDATDYAWFCWDRGGFVTLDPGVHVL